MADGLSHCHLFLFFTEGVSLETWEKGGMLEREVALYRALRSRMAGVTFVTYGGPEDLAFSAQLGEVDVICNRWRLSRGWYLRLLPLLCRWRGRGKPIVKSNQTFGADKAMSVARTLGAPFVARCGYPYVKNTRRLLKRDGPEVDAAINLERMVFSGADHVIMTTAEMKEAAVSAYGLPENHVSILPNYVITDQFAPNPEVTKIRRRVVFIGRLEVEKNPVALLGAIEGLDVELIMVGDSDQRPEFEKQAAAKGLNVQFLGNVPHSRLPSILQTAEVFVLPSFFEGHPKTLLEAMACGLAVIGADSPGIRDVIEDGVTGYLCGTDSGSIAGAIETVLGDDELKTRLGAAAREQILGENALERIVDMESDLLSDLAAVN